MPALSLQIVKIKKMKKKKNFLVGTIAAVGLVLITSSGPALAQQSGVRRTELQRHDLGVAGREVIQSRIDFDPGAAFGKHSHPGEEIIYVLEGSLEYEVEGQPPVTLKAGEVLFIPAGTVHAARNVGRRKGAELATYTVEKGKPLLTLVK
jgi:quercetin dioxygenase-like cupin family protein